MLRAVYRTSLRLKQEVAIQRALTRSKTFTYHPIRVKVTAPEVAKEVEAFFARHPAVEGKKLKFSGFHPDITLYTDLPLLLRILGNMIVNALEAGQKGDRVKIRLQKKDNSLVFSVWNRQTIPPEIGGRIFQRSFSTKAGEGRGIGTYSMKILGERILGGTVDFDSSAETGTTFCFSLPRPSPATIPST